MYRLITYLLLFMMLYTLNLAAQEKRETIIVSSHIEKKMAEEDLLTLKVYFLEHEVTRILKETQSLELRIDRYEDYYAVVITPLNDEQLRNELLVLLSVQFPDIFYVKNRLFQTEPHQRIAEKKDELSVIENTLPQVKEKAFWEEIGVEWIAIWVLAVIGLLLSFYNRYKMGSLRRTQKEIQKDQKKIEAEIKQLGDENA